MRLYLTAVKPQHLCVGNPLPSSSDVIVTRGKSTYIYGESSTLFVSPSGLSRMVYRDGDVQMIEVGGQEPSAQELAALIAEAQHEGIQVVLAQPEFSTQDAETIADEIGGEVLLVSPLAEDWLNNMREVALTFAEFLEK